MYTALAESSPDT